MRSNHELLELINRYPSIYSEGYKLGTSGIKSVNPYDKGDENIVWQCGYEDGVGDKQLDCYSAARAFIFGMEYAAIILQVEHDIPVKKQIHSVIFSRIKHLCRMQDKPLKYKIVNDDLVDIEIGSSNDSNLY